MADAYQQIADIFNQYGLGSLAQTVLGYAQQGYDDNTINLMVQ